VTDSLAHHMATVYSFILIRYKMHRFNQLFTQNWLNACNVWNAADFPHRCCCCCCCCVQHVWSESEDCLPYLQMAQDYISSCGKKTLLEVLEKVFTSFRPVRNKLFHFAHTLNPTRVLRVGYILFSPVGTTRQARS